MERDTRVVVDASLESAMILDLVRSFRSDMIEEAAILMCIRGLQSAMGKKGVAFNVRYRASDKTLTDDEVDTLHTALVIMSLKRRRADTAISNK